jgi:hypothetical protein
MSYLTNGNAQYILNILQGFFKDKYQLDIYEAIPNETLRTLVSTKMNQLLQAHKDKNISLESLNRLTLTELKESIKTNYVIAKENIETPPEQPTTIPTQISDDSDFLNKVQRLEFQRKSFQVPPPSNTNAAINNTQNQINTPIPQSISTIYMPVPPKIGKEIYIHSHQREWIYENSRSSFIWNGSIPKMQDMLCRVCCWIGPLKILQKSSCLLLHIQGANGDSQEVSLIPSYTCHYFAIYKPPLDSLGYLRMVSLPWKIQLKTSDGQNVDLGEDGDAYERFEAHPYLQNQSLLYINTPKNYAIEQSVRILTESNELINAKVLQVSNTYIEVDKKITEKGYLLNFSEQYSILLELTSGDHRPIKA